MKTRVHISLPVRDLAVSIAFYEALFGVAATKRREDYANFRLDTPALHLALYPGAVDTAAFGREGSHFGVELFDLEVLAAWRARVEAAGLATFVEEQVTCCYAKADKAWVTDPDGRPWELWVRSAEADTMFEAPRSEAPACCAPKQVAAPSAASGCCG